MALLTHHRLWLLIASASAALALASSSHSRRCVSKAIGFSIV